MNVKFNLSFCEHEIGFYTVSDAFLIKFTNMFRNSEMEIVPFPSLSIDLKTFGWIENV